MRTRVIAQQWVSLDGYAAGPSGEADIFAAVSEQADTASMQHNLRVLEEADEVLLGRATYVSFVQFWPTADLPVAAVVNTVPETVFSRSLDDAPWATSTPARVEADAVAHVQQRRRSGDGQLLLWGSLEVMGALLRAQLVDALELFGSAALGPAFGAGPAGDAGVGLGGKAAL